MQGAEHESIRFNFLFVGQQISFPITEIKFRVYRTQDTLTAVNKEFDIEVSETIPPHPEGMIAARLGLGMKINDALIRAYRKALRLVYCMREDKQGLLQIEKNYQGLPVERWDAEKKLKSLADGLTYNSPQEYLDKNPGKELTDGLLLLQEEEQLVTAGGQSITIPKLARYRLEIE